MRQEFSAGRLFNYARAAIIGEYLGTYLFNVALSTRMTDRSARLSGHNMLLQLVRLPWSVV